MSKRILTAFIGLGMMLGFSASAYAVSSYATSFKNTYPSSPLSSLSTQSGVSGNLCTVCHGTSGGTRNSFGSAYSSNGHSFTAIQNLDSDADGFTNLVEINAGTFPGSSSSKPATSACTSYTYSAWSACQSNNTQTRTVLTSIPAGCSGGVAPVTSQACTYVPPVTACTSYTYIVGACQSNNTAPVTGYTGIPAGCSGGATPATTQPCTYVPPQPGAGRLISPSTSGLYWDDTYKALGVGTALPAATLHVSESVTDAGRGILSAQHNDGAQAASVVLRKSRGTESSPSLLLTNDYIGAFIAEYWNGTSYDRSAQWGFRTDGPVIAGSAPTAIMFYTGASTRTGDPLIMAERFRITSWGDVGIGTADPGQRLEVNGGLLLNPDPAVEPKPACNSSTRGTFWFTQDDTAGDSADVCARVGGSYDWRKLF